MRLMCILAFIGLVTGSSTAFAYTFANPTNYKNTVVLPSTIVVARDAPVGTRLTGWIRAPGQTPRFWTCSGTNETIGWEYSSSKLTEPSGIDVDGFTVYKTNVPGIGIAVKAWGYMQMDVPPWSIVYNWVAHNLGLGGSSWNSGSPSYTVGGALDVMLVKIGPVTPGLLSGMEVAREFPRGTGDVHYGGGGYDAIYYSGDVAITVNSCATPDVTVDLGSHAPSELPNVGSQTTPVAFDIKLLPCDAGLKTIRFRLGSNQVTDAAKGIIGLSAESTAKGVAVKIMKKDKVTGQPINEWTSTLEPAYNATLGGNYSIPLSASIIRTDAQGVGGGTISAEAWFDMEYQ